jgi:hypothetical protein
MIERFILPLNYQGTEQEFKARFERWGYTHRIYVLIDEATFVFEPDEEGSYRALNEGSTGGLQHDIGLLEAVAEKLRTLSS